MAMKIKRIRMCVAAFAAIMVLMVSMAVPALAYDGGVSDDSQAETQAAVQETQSEKIGTVTTQGGRLNMRDGSSTSYNIIGQLACGDTVKVIGEENGWYKVIVTEKTGYVCGKYLTVTEETTDSSSTETVPADTTPETTTPVSPLTPDGNLELVDDVTQTSDGKQFITVQSKNDNTFYIVIDRDKENDNVYFLNLVDEADLMALMQDGEVTVKCTCKTRCEAGNVDTTCPVCKTNLTECTGVVQETPVETTQPEPTEEPEPSNENNSSAPMLLIVLLVGLGVGGTIYYLKFKKQKPDAKGPVDLDDYDFGDEDEDDTEYVIEDDLEDTDDADEE